jgi:arylsulfatase A-like enzyme
MWSKEIYFDQSFRVPLVIRDPRPEADASRGRHVTVFTEAIDVSPTIIDWMGGKVPRSMDGKSLVSFLEGETPPDWRREVFFEHDFRNVVSQRVESALGISSDQCTYAVIRDTDYKYVHFATLPPLLFDMRADPHETRNLADDPAMQPVILRYAQRMLSWRLTHADRTLTNMALTREGLVSRP